MTVRPLSTDLDVRMLPNLQRGVLKTVYRGVPCLKSPFDLALYLQLLSRQTPATIFEIGTRWGGSALWFADMMEAHQVEARVISVDINPPKNFSDPRIELLEGNARELGRVLTEAHMQMPKPWLVVEDSSHMFEDCLAVLRFFHRRLCPGDYIVVEDGVVAFMDEQTYGRFANGPTRAVETFLEEHPDDYVLDAALCDHFGRNVTYNPNGWLRRI